MRSSSSLAFCPKSDHVFYRITIFALELVDQIQTLLNLVQLGIVGIIGIQPTDQICGNILCIVIQIQQLTGCTGKVSSSCAAASTALDASPSRSTAPEASSSPESNA